MNSERASFDDSLLEMNQEIFQQRFQQNPVEEEKINVELAILKAENDGLKCEKDALRNECTPPRECGVCCKVFTIMKPAIALSCFPKTHHYHKECLKKMLKNGHTTCAYCRKPFTSQSIVPPQPVDNEFQQYMEIGLKRHLNRLIKAQMTFSGTQEVQAEHERLLLREAWKDARSAFEQFADARKVLISLLEKQVWYFRGQVIVNIFSIVGEIASIPVFFTLGPIASMAISGGCCLSRIVLNEALFRKICCNDEKTQQQYETCEQLSNNPEIKRFIQLYDRMLQSAFERAKKNDDKLLTVAYIDTWLTISAWVLSHWSQLATNAFIAGSVVTLAFQCYYTYKDTKQKLDQIDLIKDYIKTMKHQDKMFKEKVKDLEMETLSGRTAENSFSNNP